MPQWQDIDTIFMDIHHLLQNSTEGSDNCGEERASPHPHEYRTARATFHEEGKQHKTTNYSFLAHNISIY